MYSFLNIVTYIYEWYYYYCLPAIVCTLGCLTSNELSNVCSLCEDSCSTLCRESIGKSCPQGEDFLIHSLQRGSPVNLFLLTRWHPKMPPGKVMSIDSVKINPSLVMMRE